MNVAPIYSIFQLLLLLSNKFLIFYTSCERTPESKIETKVDIEVTYVYTPYHEKSNILFPDKEIRDKLLVSYNIPNSPKTIGPEIRGSNRQAANNNNLRPGFRFSTSEKGAGAFTIPTHENDGSDNGIRPRINRPVTGRLIHVVSVSEQSLDGAGNATVLSWSHNACQDTLNNVQGYQWVALVQTGSCSAEQKLKQIMKLANQPAGILIYGSSHISIKQDPFTSQTQEDPPMVIFLPYNNIHDIVQKCLNSSGKLSIPPEIQIKMNRTQHQWPFHGNNQCNISIFVQSIPDDNFLNKTSVLFVSISFILLMVISLAWLMFYYVQRFRYIHTKEQFSRRLAHMAKKAVAKIPVKTIKQGDKETDAEVDNCAICIECYKPSDTVRILPCKHYFHKSCIDPWLLEQRSCPMCKLNILHAYGFLPNERGSIISEDRLSELDSSLELQFMTGSAVAPYPGPSTRIQAHIQARDCLESGNLTVPSTAIITLPQIFTEPTGHGLTQWTSLRLKRTLRNIHQIDRSVSLRHISSNVEERTTFLPQNRPLSQSATNNTTLETERSLSQWRDVTTSSYPNVKLSDS